MGVNGQPFRPLQIKMFGYGVLHRLNKIPWKFMDFLRRPRVIRSRGVTFSIRCDNWITKYRFDSFETKEPEMLDWVENVMQPSDTFFDVGANIGVYSLFAAKRHPASHVVCFEPEYSNLHYLRDNILDNALADRVKVFSLGLGDKSMLTTLHIQDMTPGAALHTASSETIENTKSNKAVVFREGVYVMTLDEFCEKSNLFPNCLKIDVDGNECDVLRGAQKSLTNPNFRSVILELDMFDGNVEEAGTILSGAGLALKFQKESSGCMIQIWSKN